MCHERFEIYAMAQSDPDAQKNTQPLKQIGNEILMSIRDDVISGLTKSLLVTYPQSPLYLDLQFLDKKKKKKTGKLDTL